MIRQYELVERVRAYDPDLNENLLNRAYVFSLKAHGTQKRASGDPYFSHPLEVAGILTNMQLDNDTIVTALLHDTIEDTVATYEQIEELFGENIARMVDGVTKMSEIEYTSESSKQAENFSKFLLAISDDIRVLLVKLADRLHNMRTLHHVPKAAKRLRIARETLDIYAPLAERIGIQEIKEELEGLAFPYVYPEAHESILKRLDYLHANTEDIREQVVSELEELLTGAGVEAEVMGREKKPYSIWRKMTYRNVSLEDQADIVAFRVIVDDVEGCYRALGIVHGKWQSVPDLLKDYISTPKPNGYQSIHTTVMGPEKKRIEIQIRTGEMDMVAERGVAAHWRYKQHTTEKEGALYRWLQDLLEILEHAGDPEEFLEHTKMAMYQNQVFCFTPKGEIINLPAGATVVDFAYAVHTKVGDTCVGAKVNGKSAQPWSRLSNGDQVEVLRSNGQKPQPGWANFVLTGKARAAIRRSIRQDIRGEHIALGNSILERAFEREKREYTRKSLSQAATRLHYHNADALLEMVGSGEVSERKILETVFPGIKLSAGDNRNRPVRNRRKNSRKAGDHSLPIKGLTPGFAVHLAECCHPLPGERIVGIVTRGKGIMVHAIDCDALEAYADTPETWLDLSWAAKEDDPEIFIGKLDVLLSHEAGALAVVLAVIAQEDGNVSNIKVSDRSADLFRIELDIEVRDVKHLTNIIAALQANKRVNSVERSFK